MAHGHDKTFGTEHTGNGLLPRFDRLTERPLSDPVAPGTVARDTEVAIALEHEQQASELVLDGGRIGGLASGHQRVQDLCTFAVIGVLAEISEDIFGSRGMVLAERLLQSLPPGVELAEAIRQ